MRRNRLDGGLADEQCFDMSGKPSHAPKSDMGIKIGRDIILVLLAIFMEAIVKEYIPDLAPLVPYAVFLILALLTWEVINWPVTTSVARWIHKRLPKQWYYMTISYVVICVSGAVLFGFYWHLVTRRPAKDEPTLTEDQKLIKALKEEYPIGFKLFSISRKDLYPFQGDLEMGLIVHMERQNYSWEGTDAKLALNLPDIDILPNVKISGVKMVMPNEIGSSVTLRIDPNSFERGAAINSNIFERMPTPSLPVGRPPVGAILSQFPGKGRISHFVQATVIWDTYNSYELGAINNAEDLLEIKGGILRTNRPNICDEAVLVRGNTFIGGPRGGYRFPKASAIVGNIFHDVIFDARIVPDGAIISNNTFTSRSGIYVIGAEPTISFVVKIISTPTEGACLLFGARPYVDSE